MILPEVCDIYDFGTLQLYCDYLQRVHVGLRPQVGAGGVHHDPAERERRHVADIQVRDPPCSRRRAVRTGNRNGVDVLRELDRLHQRRGRREQGRVLPGFHEDSRSVDVQGRGLTIKGRRRQPELQVTVSLVYYIYYDLL